uniref:Peptidase S1 domain-containing protein n=1 Tax=Anopheles culicifacies TaxID=139723 RepID=A0A182MN19_9DIPT
MGRWLRVFLRATLICIFAASSQAIRDKRMASGTDVMEQWEVPYQVSFRYIEQDRHLGSGAILNVRYIITQASFIWKLLRTYPEQPLSRLARIRVGQVELRSKADDQFRSIYSYTYHPSFDFEAARNDVALVRTLEYIEFNEFVQPVAIFKGSIPAGSVVMYTDWGAEKDTAAQDEYKEKLQKLDARAISNDECKELLSPWDLQELVYDTRLCIYTNGTGSICTVLYYRNMHAVGHKAVRVFCFSRETLEAHWWLSRMENRNSSVSCLTCTEHATRSFRAVSNGFGTTTDGLLKRLPLTTALQILVKCVA